MQKSAEVRLIDVSTYAPLQPLIFSEDEPLIVIAFVIGVAKRHNVLIKSADGSFIGEAGAVDLFQAFYLDFKDVWQKLYTIRLKNVARKDSSMQISRWACTTLRLRTAEKDLPMLLCR
ncbi:MAG: hypothetical protein ACP5GS_08055 [Nitrososphaeria archaeon]